MKMNGEASAQRRSMSIFIAFNLSHKRLFWEAYISTSGLRIHGAISNSSEDRNPSPEIVKKNKWSSNSRLD